MGDDKCEGNWTAYYQLYGGEGRSPRRERDHLPLWGGQAKADTFAHFSFNHED
jgi:hypothetical protein